MSSSLVNNKYRITRRIGGGSFGEIYLGVGPSGEKVAVKFEKHGSRCPQLRHEYKVYREVASCHGFCAVHHFGTQDNYNVMVMDLLGPSLEDLFNRCGRRFSLKTCLQIADQMLERVDTFHSRHLIHRDIKPANFVIGTGEQCNVVFCVDFGLSKRFRHPKNLQHIPHRDGRSLTGTPRYASINNHLGIEQSRRDDLESIAYVLVYFLKGSLPWQGLKAKNAQKKYRLILEKKQQVSIAQLCAGCPSQFGEFLAYTRALKFDTKPDIPFLRKMFRDLYHAQGCASVGKLWDWDSAEADQMIVGANETLVSTNAPNMSSGPSGLSGSNDIGEMGFDGKRINTAGAVGQGGNWGVKTDEKVSSQREPIHDPVATRSATSLHRDGVRQTAEDEGVDRQDSLLRRPHTATGGRVEEDNHVVASTRAMMQYRRTRTDGTQQSQPSSGAQQQQLPVQQSQQQAGQQGSNTRWANSMFNEKEKAAPQGTTTTNPQGSRGAPQPTPNAAALNGMRNNKNSDSIGRPRSAGVGATTQQVAPSTRPSETNRPSSGNGAAPSATGSGNGNGMSYGSLKNRFLSGSKGKSSKLFGLSR